MLKNALITSLFILLTHFGLFSQNEIESTTINPNNVEAVINSNGVLFWDFNQGQFNTTNNNMGEALSVMKASGLWLGGIDPGGNLKGAIQLYNEDDKSDFIPGALHPDGLAQIGLNKIWHVSGEEIDQHLADFADNGIIDNPQEGVLGWPARGNPFFSLYNPGMELPNTSQGLAGFWDENEDGIYNPANGDYPIIEIRGCEEAASYADEMWWFVFNDATPHTESNMTSMGMEIQCQVFAYNCEEETSLNNSIFARYKFINRGEEILDSTYFGMFFDHDIGNPNDDFFGCDTSRNVVFGYNGDEFDEGGYENESPVISMDLFRGPLIRELDPTTGQLQIEFLGMTHVMPVNSTESLADVDYYKLLTGKTVDGSPVPLDGVFYPGNPNNSDQWSEITNENDPGDRKVLVSSGPFKLDPGAINEIILAFTFHHTEGNTPLENVSEMYENVDDVQVFFDNCLDKNAVTCNMEVATKEISELPGKVFPNPTQNELNIWLEDDRIQEISIMNISGQQVFSKKIQKRANQVSINLESLNNGLYFLIVETNDSKLFKEKVVLQRN